MFIHGPACDLAQVQPLTRGDHGLGQIVGLTRGHAPQDDGHRPSGGLIIRDLVMGEAFDKEVDFLTRELASVSLLANDVDGPHGFPPMRLYPLPLSEQKTARADRQQGCSAAQALPLYN